jgi:hypothetical protein
MMPERVQEFELKTRIMVKRLEQYQDTLSKQLAELERRVAEDEHTLAFNVRAMLCRILDPVDPATKDALIGPRVPKRKKK